MEVNPLNFLGLAILGAALLWAVHLVYSARRAVSGDTLQILLLLAGWLLLVGGVLGVLVGFTGPIVVFPLVALAIILGTYFKYAAAERRALLWALAVAAERGIPLDQAARAFAEERAVPLGLRAARLAELLEAGAPLPQALDLSRNPVSTDALLAARMGHELGVLGPALRMSLEHSEQTAVVMRSLLAKLCYFLLVAWVGLVVIVFMALKIIPVFQKMFDEFGLKLPHLTQLVIDGMRVCANYWFILGPPPILLVLAVTLVALAYYVGWSRYELPLLQRFWLRRESALVLRALAFAVRQQRPLAPTLHMLVRQYPKVSVAQRLARASAAVEQGVHWCDALQQVGLLQAVEAGVLRAAERVGNLPWALEEMADSTWRRFALRLHAAVGFLSPVLILILGLAVACLVIGLFLPLIALIQGLA
jgi:protein transport protein HofC